MHLKLTSKQPALVNRKDPIVLNDNLRPHVSMITSPELQTLNYEVLDHPTGLLPTNYHFFKHLTNFLQEKCLKNPKGDKIALNKFLASKTNAFYGVGIKILGFLLPKLN